MVRGGAVADPECARGGGVSDILAEKGVSASLYFKKCMKMQYFHQEEGGVRRVRPMLEGGGGGGGGGVT